MKHYGNNKTRIWRFRILLDVNSAIHLKNSVFHDAFSSLREDFILRKPLSELSRMNK